MESDNDIRWQQRYNNFSRAYVLLEKSLLIPSPSETECAGIIQFYEMTFELAWKLLKDYLELQGFSVKSPRDTIKQAFQAGIIENGHTWMDALEDRNLTVHTYDEDTAAEILSKIRHSYFPELKQLNSWAQSQIN